MTISKHGAPAPLRITCAAHVHGIIDPSMYLHNRELKRQAQQAEQGRLLETIDLAAATVIKVRTQAGMSTKVGDVESFL